MTCAALSVTLAVSHLPAAFGAAAASRCSSPSGRTSATVRGTGVRSYTAATSAIRFRLRFSPLDNRVESFWLAAAFAVAARSPSGRITTPLASKLVVQGGEVHDAHRPF